MNYYKLIIFTLFIGFTAKAEILCSSREVEAHYRASYGHHKSQLVARQANINKDERKDLLVSAKDSCGLHGCESIIYLSEGQCFRPVLMTRGKIKVQSKKTSDVKPLLVSFQGPHLERSFKKTYIYNKAFKKYVANEEE